MNNTKYYILTILLIIVTAYPAIASDEQLILIDGKHRISLPVQSLRQQAHTKFTLFAPFRGREVQMRGILLETLFEQHLHRVPQDIKLVSHDGHEVTLKKWQLNHWLIVTHEDGQPLTIRKQGPLRLVAREYAGKNPKNLRAFNDWIWMLQSIHTLQ